MISVRRFSSLPSWFNTMVHSNPSSLPRLPLPPFQATLDKYVSSLSPLLSPSMHTQHVTLVNSFRNETVLYESLKIRNATHEKRGEYPYSYIEEDWDTMYLGGRYPSVVNVNPCYGLLEEAFQGLSKDGLCRSAKMIRSILKFRMKMKNGELEVEKGACMSTMAKQFGASRIPNLTCDHLEYYPESCHIVVLHRNAFYKVAVQGGEGMIGEEKLVQALTTIMEKSGPLKPSAVADMTGEERDVWATFRNNLQDHSEQNAVTLEMIDSALLVLVLDERSSSEVGEQAALSLHGNGQDRWFDKLQMMTYSDGHIGFNFEHSTSDGTAWNRWLHEVLHDMTQTNSGYTPLPPLPTCTVEEPVEYTWDLTTEMEKQVEISSAKLQTLCTDVDMVGKEYTNLNKNSIKEWKCSPDAAIQMVFQLAFYSEYNKMTPTYESCSTRAFHHGRTETIRSATTQASAFVQSMSDPTASCLTKKGAFDTAVMQHTALAKEAQGGMGVDRLLLAMHNLAKETGKVHPFLTDPTRSMSSSFRISSSNVTMPWLSYFGFGPVVSDGYGLGYLIQDKSIRMTISSFKGCKDTTSSRMEAAIGKAMDDIKDIHK